MKKIITSMLLCAVIAVVGVFSLVASADVSDVKIDCKKAKDASTWGKSLSVSKETFDVARITDKTQIVVTFEYKDKKQAKDITSSPIGLALQCYNNPDNALADDKGAVWAEVTPTTYDENSAIFYYQDLVKAYTSKDFTTVDFLHVIAPSSVAVKCTSMTITDCNDKAPETTTTTEAPKDESVAETTAETTAAETTAATTTISAAEKSDSSSSPILLIVGIIAGVAIAVIVIVVIMNKKSSEAFDVSTGKFVDKKNLFDENKDEDKK
ncbi:hypothetical protein [uncultured Ruminococcus sp.]|uniref:hypothetical protein n=1 Tax=uncultured Ruminococcus sp. TaxID=165186 RepID=UPI0026385F0F|nr:hypothetical protein [uncultured Ruminococcus sp.]